MTMDEFFEAFADPESGLTKEINNIRLRYGLEKLYPIHASSEQFVWGARGTDIDWQRLVFDLVSLVLEKTGADYNTEMTGMAVFQDGVSEVEIVIAKLIRDYVESHDGRIELESIDEALGKVVVSMSGTCGGCSQLPATLKDGVERILKSRLPWVKKVSLFGSEPESHEEAMSVTEKAARKIWLLAKEMNFGNSAGLRIKITPGGCSGFKYELQIEESPSAGDEVCTKQFEEGGNQSAGRVFIDPQSLQFLKGSTLDHVRSEDGLSENFKISNPNAKSSCGCGKSESF